MRYIEVIFTIRNGENWQKDLLIQDLAGLGFDSFEDREDGFAGYIPAAQYDGGALDLLLFNQSPTFDVDFSHREIKPENWNALWESNFQPLVIADQVYVRATFHREKPEYPLEILIDPKMAFGTGHHQTTSMMMRLLLQLDLKDKRVLDMGCGTGILAILAAKLGAREVFAIDYDPVCESSTRENIVLNQVPGIEVDCGSVELITGMKVDLVLANINRNILMEHLEHYAAAMDPGAYLLMSGFYEGNDEAVLTEKARSLGLIAEERLTDKSWAAVCFRAEN